MQEMAALAQQDQPPGLSSGNPRPCGKRGWGWCDGKMSMGNAEPMLETAVGAKLGGTSGCTCRKARVKLKEKKNKKWKKKKECSANC